MKPIVFRFLELQSGTNGRCFLDVNVYDLAMGYKSGDIAIRGALSGFRLSIPPRVGVDRLPNYSVQGAFSVNINQIPIISKTLPNYRLLACRAGEKKNWQEEGKLLTCRSRIPS